MIKGEREGGKKREKQRWDCMGERRNMKGKSVARGRRDCRWEEGKQLIMCRKKSFYKQPQIIS